MRQLLTKYIHEDIGFSKNGHEAYLRGEKPAFMFHKDTLIRPTVKHHIEIKLKTYRGFTYKRPLVMFYEENK